MVESIRYITMNGADYISNGMVAEATGKSVEEVIAEQQRRFGRTTQEKEFHQRRAPFKRVPNPRTTYIAE